jgi:flagellar hook-associated protein 1 FlgK
MLRFQHAYQAAARVITIMDEMLNTLINNTGLVGR